MGGTYYYRLVELEQRARLKVAGKDGVDLRGPERDKVGVPHDLSYAAASRSVMVRSYTSR